jgi:S-(hydroxymethyl)glutathione dehydrogenase / alcohol dehydrogenase
LKAAVLYEVNTPLRVVEVNLEGPRRGEVLIRMGAAGLCASDHHVIHGTGTLPLPCALGHEGAGTVEAVGDGVSGLEPGDPCILSFVSHCGHCRSCREGFPQLCDTNRVTGSRQQDGTFRMRDREGNDVYQMSKISVFSEQSVVPAQACYPIPREVPLEVAALIGCCVTTGVGAVINAPGIRAGATVAVFGCGGVGLNVIQGARLMNAARVIAVDLFDHKLEFTRHFGATDLVDASKADPVMAIRELTGGGVDYAFDAFGGAVTISQAVDCLRKTGTAVMVGLAPAGERAPIDMVDLVRNQKTLVGSYYGSASPQETFAKMVDFYQRGLVDVSGLIQRRYSLQQINEGFEALENHENGRGVIDFSRG